MPRPAKNMSVEAQMQGEMEQHLQVAAACKALIPIVVTPGCKDILAQEQQWREGRAEDCRRALLTYQGKPTTGKSPSLLWQIKITKVFREHPASGITLARLRTELTTMGLPATLPDNHAIVKTVVENMENAGKLKRLGNGSFRWINPSGGSTPDYNNLETWEQAILKFFRAHPDTVISTFQVTKELTRQGFPLDDPDHKKKVYKVMKALHSSKKRDNPLQAVSSGRYTLQKKS